MDYQKREPAGGLSHSIDAYVFYRHDGNDVISDCFFPNGKPAIVLHLGNVFSHLWPDGRWENMPTVSFICFARGPVSLRSGGVTDTIAVLLNPYSIYNIYGLRICRDEELIDSRSYVPLELCQQLKAASDVETRVMLLDEYFTGKLKGYDPETDLFKRICDHVIMNKGMVERHAVAVRYGVSESYVHKVFMQKTGISFKPYAQIVRISNIMEEIYHSGNHDWFEIVEKYDFYDQAHFIRDFKKVTGKTPHQYYHMDKRLSSIFTGIA